MQNLCLIHMVIDKIFQSLTILDFVLSSQLFNVKWHISFHGDATFFLVRLVCLLYISCIIGWSSRRFLNFILKRAKSLAMAWSFEKLGLFHSLSFLQSFDLVFALSHLIFDVVVASCGSWGFHRRILFVCRMLFSCPSMLINWTRVYLVFQIVENSVLDAEVPFSDSWFELGDGYILISQISVEIFIAVTHEGV